MDGRELPILDRINLSLSRSQVIALVGPSGCGKSTLLNVISGLDQPTSGSVVLADGLQVGYMMQEPLLLSWRTLADNAHLGLELKSHGVTGNRDVVGALFRQFGLAGFENLPPAAASGGMKQRTALIRTLATGPTCVLLDEPFSNLDFDVKLVVQRVLLELVRDRSMAIILVTHDLDDAIALSDELILLTQRPARVSRTFSMSWCQQERDPMKARASRKFSEYFAEISEAMGREDEE